ncbi:1,4-dihydroxy-2-naphthoate polyprenyltransferase [Haloferax mediterranei]|nr:1,4-dihydroxy-2-naphthoate polyprenyltransferase [Haloferax mediterranei]AHZ21404.1 1,4-dihydroxy-2-naphthoate prenyltransferase [Haloferax mediterranei ATCC 33500]EMA03862.1 1,4-dihydroxy-2-naphthoate octaprenyltransferase [Haloferax mediterranei ATCC 33500]
MASRPQTLPAAAAPVLVGTALAVHAGKFAPLPALAALVGALLIQIGTNFANDYYDAIQGADTEAREGFTRVTAGGLIPPSEVKRAMYLTFAAAILLGTYLVYVGGVPILVIGLLSVASGIAYTGGPYPLGYHGLGDLFVFIFFGLVAVVGTFYVQAVSFLAPFPVGIPEGTVTLVAIVVSLPIAALSTNILVVNNVRDKEEDATTGKRTLAVRFGYGVARGEYLAMLALAYAVPFYLWSRSGFEWFVLLPALSMPIAARIAQTVMTETKGEKLNPALEDTGKLLALYAVLFSVGLVLA